MLVSVDLRMLLTLRLLLLFWHLVSILLEFLAQLRQVQIGFTLLRNLGMAICTFLPVSLVNFAEALAL